MTDKALETDHYADGTYRWWHLSDPSPELLHALADGWLPASGHGLDVGCGLGTEGAHLHRIGWSAVGVDLSPVALACAAQVNPGPSYLRADLLCLPLRSSSFEAALDRGCFHYLAPEDRVGYADELSRVLRPGGKLLLRASLRAAGIRNDIDDRVILATFAAWRLDHMQRAKIPSDSRTLEVLLVRLTSPGG
ncbi:MAG: class I SAM-dependent methyltransferase [Acidimicrobiales bacterium]